jgi:hypothetical protein
MFRSLKNTIIFVLLRGVDERVLPSRGVGILITGKK